MITTDKISAVSIIAALKNRGCSSFVISPGSRNAPLIRAVISLVGDESAQVVVDERSAAFLALGIALSTNKPVALFCTSGTALLNYAPAIAEAHYLGLPLVVVSADRPSELIDTGNGQCIRQQNVFNNFQKGFLQFEADEKNFNDIFLKVTSLLKKSLESKQGPVHINVAFDEPLYGSTHYDDHLFPSEEIVELPNKEFEIEPELLSTLSGKKVMLLIGVLTNSENSQCEQDLIHVQNSLNWVVLYESTSNINLPNGISNIDRVLTNFDQTQYPEVLITIGEHIVSKRIKQILKSSPLKFHFHISEGGIDQDLIGRLTKTINCSTQAFFSQLQKLEPAPVSFVNSWLQVNSRVQVKHDKFLDDVEYSDLSVFDQLLKSIPDEYHLHSANSSVVRYIQLFDYSHIRYIHANRGTSGIDGSTSTAVGYAKASSQKTAFITGDLSFLYDSNALWIKDIPPSFRIIVINNDGGGIFRFIPGPTTVKNHDKYFEATHSVKISGLAEAFSFNYMGVDSKNSLNVQLEKFFEPSSNPKILEIKTPRTINDQILKQYFQYLKG